MMSKFLTGFIFFFCLSLNAKTLVIVDIDDTLRPTNRIYGSYAEQLENILNLDLHFSGMKELMDVFHQQQATIYYLTSAVAPIDKVGELFLKHNKYPQRHHYINKNWWSDTEDYKVLESQNLIYKLKPDKIILIGDNGEKDSAAYSRLQAVYPNVHVYIHYLYKHASAAPLNAQQLFYITSAEVSAHLEESGVFSSEESQRVFFKVHSDAISADPLKKYLVLPYWSDITSDDIGEIFSKNYVISIESQQLLLSIKNTLLTF